MRIGVNCLPLSVEIGGLRQYFQRLFRILFTVDHENSYVFFYHQRNLKELEQIENDTWRKGAIEVANTEQILDHLAQIDMLFCPFTVLEPRPLPIASVVTLPDIQEVFYPQFFSESQLEFRKLHYPASTQAADSVITLSNYSKQTIAEHHKISQDKIFVAYPSLDQSAFQFERNQSPNRQREQKFLFYPANTWPHKNHDVLLKALLYLKTEMKLIVPSVFAGFPVPKSYPLEKKIYGFSLSDSVRFMGYVSNEQMEHLYRNATLLCFPSLFEGFGIPVLEAMVAGCPVACANTTSLPEIAGDAGIYFNPNDPQEMAKVIRSLWENPSLRNQMAAHGTLQAAKFTSEQMAKVHLTAFTTGAHLFKKRDIPTG
jgi:glycosyltransferase involved in cell wall biosynthesis